MAAAGGWLGGQHITCVFQGHPICIEGAATLLEETGWGVLSGPGRTCTAHVCTPGVCVSPQFARFVSRAVCRAKPFPASPPPAQLHVSSKPPPPSCPCPPQRSPELALACSETAGLPGAAAGPGGAAPEGCALGRLGAPPAGREQHGEVHRRLRHRETGSTTAGDRAEKTCTRGEK